jgi:transposase-like protein
LKEKAEAGLRWEQLVPLLPGRSLNAIKLRHYKLKQDGTGLASQANARKPWSPEDRQRVIDMILVDGLSLKAVSKRLGRSKGAVQKVWQTHGLKVLPADTTQKFRGENDWSPEQDEILIEQRRKGVLFKDIVSSIPGKSLKALCYRATRLQISAYRLSPVQIATIREALQAVHDGAATFDEVASKFSSLTSRASVRAVWFKMRHGRYKT